MERMHGHFDAVLWWDDGIGPHPLYPKRSEPCVQPSAAPACADRLCQKNEILPHRRAFFPIVMRSLVLSFIIRELCLIETRARRNAAIVPLCPRALNADSCDGMRINTSEPKQKLSRDTQQQPLHVLFKTISFYDGGAMASASTIFRSCSMV